MRVPYRAVTKVCWYDKVDYCYNKHMYFESRWQAGEVLARELFDRYRYENCAVIALSDGGAVVGEQIASWLHTSLSMIVTEEIEIPGESLVFGALDQGGGFIYNDTFSGGEVDEYNSEFQSYLGEMKREAFQKINRLVGSGGTIDFDRLKDRVLVLVSDGLRSSMAISAAINFLKPVRYSRLVVAAPVADVSVVDTIHMLADELHILDVKSNYLDTDHYYDDNNIPSHEEVIRTIDDMLLHWR
jgi:Predicted phosphoribosyltransferases